MLKKGSPFDVWFFMVPDKLPNAEASLHINHTYLALKSAVGGGFRVGILLVTVVIQRSDSAKMLRTSVHISG